MSRTPLALLLSALTLATAGALPAHAAQPALAASATTEQATQAGYYRFNVGELQVTALSDGSVPVDSHALLKGLSTEQIDKLLARGFQTNPVETSINAFLIDTGKRLVLVDTGAGTLFGAHTGGKLLGSLSRIGVKPEQIDDILITHLHSDHSGGLVQGGQIVFPNAVVHVAKSDIDYFLAADRQNGVPGYDKSYFKIASDSISPYLASGQVKTFEGSSEVLPGITTISAPGHTPGHSNFRLKNGEDSITFIGDLVHVYAVQMPNPKVTIDFDLDQPSASAQRKNRFDAFVAQRERIAAAHLPYPGIGHLRQDGQGYAFVPVDYRFRP